ncbi:hypothetical protein M8Q32_13410 [Enterobacter hormaechei]|uniref:hypothetical protein n=1 Tax=Enterobacter cloacae complex TaxID=354276 RepID=UPI0011DCA1B0|nr:MULTISPECIES: hypothetical protein [Enterobacter cloacae complex]HCM9689171.1 hypothetical protein [Enterobacter cloacae subsp. cloacae]MCF2395641.1 hypothetical protein [Enterobacter hormaechei subsp. xiangfangensis]MCM7243687.1 hypothetical protein [Enterobacter hormaechei]MCM7247613.1 hypothetical protein [Enterobacter hormaechei]MCW4934691.1 hypothetical protein [Enterobacter hormaechei subsp. xiangfangensis]
MKLFEMEGFLRGKCLPGDMKVNETNAEYLVRKFAEADARCAALAAENACLKQSIEEVSEAFETGTDGALATAVDESLNLLTPETDAVLKRIQAHGVAMFASKCKEESKRAHSSDARDSWWVSGENADDFADQLRQEAAQ